MRSVSYVVRPLQWVGSISVPKLSPFRATWTKTLDVLDRELYVLGARNIVLQMDVTSGQIRRDGEVRADARPGSPRIRLLFDSRRGALAFQCGTWSDWRDNVRAVALGLEALRKVDRYGITTGGEQYKGYLAIESGGAARTPATVLTDWAGDVSEGDDLRTVWRRARANAHPDRNGGARTGWDAVEDAARKLGLAS